MPLVRYYFSPAFHEYPSCACCDSQKDLVFQTIRATDERLRPPAINATDIVQACAAGITIPDRAQALTDALPIIMRCEAEYSQLGPAGQLYRILPSLGVTAAIDAALMGIIYKNHFAPQGSPSRVLYDRIRMAPEFSLCPLCGQVSASSRRLITIPPVSLSSAESNASQPGSRLLRLQQTEAGHRSCKGQRIRLSTHISMTSAMSAG